MKGRTQCFLLFPNSNLALRTLQYGIFWVSGTRSYWLHLSWRWGWLRTSVSFSLGEVSGLVLSAWSCTSAETSYCSCSSEFYTQTKYETLYVRLPLPFSSVRHFLSSRTSPSYCCTYRQRWLQEIQWTARRLYQRVKILPQKPRFSRQIEISLANQRFWKSLEGNLPLSNHWREFDELCDLGFDFVVDLGSPSALLDSSIGSETSVCCSL